MESFGKYLREYWFIVIFIGMIVVSWTTFSTRLSAVEDRLKVLEDKSASLEQIKIDIAVIKEKLTNIDKKI
jgi:hypothetical protein